MSVAWRKGAAVRNWDVVLQDARRSGVIQLLDQGRSVSSGRDKAVNCISAAPHNKAMNLTGRGGQIADSRAGHRALRRSGAGLPSNSGDRGRGGRPDRRGSRAGIGPATGSRSRCIR